MAETRDVLLLFDVDGTLTPSRLVRTVRVRVLACEDVSLCLLRSSRLQ